jgi:hypothetical protein
MSVKVRLPPLPAAGPFLPHKGNNVALIARPFLPNFPAHNGKANRPKNDKAQDHPEDFGHRPGLTRRAPTPLASSGMPRRGLTGYAAIGTHRTTPFAAHLRRLTQAQGQRHPKYRYGFCQFDAYPGASAGTFCPHGAGDMSRSMERILTDRVLRDTLVARGRERVKLYSWRKAAQATLAVRASRKA